MKFRVRKLYFLIYLLFTTLSLQSQYNAFLNCDSVPFLSCGEPFFLGHDFISTEYLVTCLEYSDTDRETNVWRSFLGNGQTIQFNPLVAGDAINIYEGDCTNLTCSPDELKKYETVVPTM